MTMPEISTKVKELLKMKSELTREEQAFIAAIQDEEKRKAVILILKRAGLIPKERSENNDNGAG